MINSTPNKFRPHRGSLIESMALAVDVHSIEDIKDSASVDRGCQLTFTSRGHDPRNGWDTYLVSTSFGVIGFSDFDGSK